MSKTVPEPITLFVGNPETLPTTYVIKSTGLLAIRNIPLNPEFTTFSVISDIIFVFVFAKSSLVSPGFWATPAVITTIFASLHSS